MEQEIKDTIGLNFATSQRAVKDCEIEKHWHDAVKDAPKTDQVTGQVK